MTNSHITVSVNDSFTAECLCTNFETQDQCNAKFGYMVQVYDKDYLYEVIKVMMYKLNHLVLVSILH